MSKNLLCSQDAVITTSTDCCIRSTFHGAWKTHPNELRISQSRDNEILLSSVGGGRMGEERRVI